MNHSDYRILIIDDEEDLLNVMAEVLELESYCIDTALTGTKALELLARNQYNLVITDLNITDIVGWKLADIVYAKYPDCRIILATGWGLKITTEKCIRHNINGLLYKPFKMQDILEVVSKVLAGSRKEVLVGSV